MNRKIYYEFTIGVLENCMAYLNNIIKYIYILYIKVNFTRRLEWLLKIY